MKFVDVRKMVEAGLITPEQQARINAHFNLKEDESRFLRIISFVGAALVAAGIILLISSNWEQIPRGIKLAAGIALMLGAHAGGWYLRETRGDYPKVGEALQVVGSALFLANIALVGQIYSLSSRAPNAIALWVVGIAALPWLLRSKAQWLLFLAGFAIWFGMEVNERDGLLYYGNDIRQIALFASLGLVYLGTGYALRGTRYSDFSPIAERLGLFGFLLLFFPLTWSLLYRSHDVRDPVPVWILPSLLLVALGLIVGNIRKFTELSAQWRWTWLGALAGAAILLGAGIIIDPGLQRFYTHDLSVYRWFATVGLFVFCLLQIQVGIEERSEFMVNAGVLFVALNIITTYLNLFGSMAMTGIMFVVSGVFLIAFGIYLEKKRRALLARMHSATGGTVAAV